MGWLKTVVCSAAALAILGAAARAADFPGYPEEPPPLAEPPLLSPGPGYYGWYLRGDLGYRFQNFDSASDLTTSFTNTSLSSPLVGTLGVGYKFKWFRLDVTGDYGGPNTFNGADASGAHTITMKVDTYTVMVNGYLDLGTWWGFTPYVGAGIGKARMETHNLVESPALATPVAAQYQWNVAWSAMAGFSYPLSETLLLDVGYRHVSMGDINGGPASNPFTVKNVTGDEVRVGLRYMFDN
jgi:opacity protein-like surface antigen